MTRLFSLRTDSSERVVIQEDGSMDFRDGNDGSRRKPHSLSNVTKLVIQVKIHFLLRTHRQAAWSQQCPASRVSMRNTGVAAEVNQVFGYYAVRKCQLLSTLAGLNPISAWSSFVRTIIQVLATGTY
jgi:hypothetical protein